MCSECCCVVENNVFTVNVALYSFLVLGTVIGCVRRGLWPTAAQINTPFASKTPRPCLRMLQYFSMNLVILPMSSHYLFTGKSFRPGIIKLRKEIKNLKGLPTAFI